MNTTLEYVKIFIRYINLGALSHIVMITPSEGITSFPISKSIYSPDLPNIIFVVPKVCLEKGIPWTKKDIYSYQEVMDILDRNKKKEIPEDIRQYAVTPEECFPEPDKPVNEERFLFYHAREKGSAVTVCGIVSKLIDTDTSILSFGLSKCRKKDQFSKKYGREQAKIRAIQEPTLVTSFKDFHPVGFVTVAKTISRHVLHNSDWGRSLVSSKVALPEPTKEKRKFTSEEIQQAKSSHVKRMKNNDN